MQPTLDFPLPPTLVCWREMRALVSLGQRPCWMEPVSCSSFCSQKCWAAPGAEGQMDRFRLHCSSLLPGVWGL